MNVEGAFPGPVYSAAAQFNPASAATGDIFTIAGATGYLIRVLGMYCIITGAAAASPTMAFTKRSTLDTAGTSATAALVPHDSNDPAAQAVVRSYTAMPTPGTLIGNVRSDLAVVNGAGGLLLAVAAQLQPYPVVLRTAVESLCVNLGNAVTTPVARCWVMWTEEVIV